MGYPAPDLEPETHDALQEAIVGLRLESQPFGPPERRTILLTASGEPAWSHGGGMVLLSARLLRTLLMHMRFLRPPRPGRRRRLDMKV
jgi:hypothetical protein